MVPYPFCGRGRLVGRTRLCHWRNAAGICVVRPYPTSATPATPHTHFCAPHRSSPHADRTCREVKRNDVLTADTLQLGLWPRHLAKRAWRHDFLCLLRLLVRFAHHELDLLLVLHCDLVPAKTTTTTTQHHRCCGISTCNTASAATPQQATPVMVSNIGHSVKHRSQCQTLVKHLSNTCQTPVQCRTLYAVRTHVMLSDVEAAATTGVLWRQRQPECCGGNNDNRSVVEAKATAGVLWRQKRHWAWACSCPGMDHGPCHTPRPHPPVLWPHEHAGVLVRRLFEAGAVALDNGRREDWHHVFGEL
eukprot:358824-Chlamydomonas_euryale.AAC.6